VAAIVVIIEATPRLYQVAERELPIDRQGVHTPPRLHDLRRSTPPASPQRGRRCRLPPLGTRRTLGVHHRTRCVPRTPRVHHPRTSVVPHHPRTYLVSRTPSVPTTRTFFVHAHRTSIVPTTTRTLRPHRRFAVPTPLPASATCGRHGPSTFGAAGATEHVRSLPSVVTVRLPGGSDIALTGSLR
jgi:hypothetical protein